MWVFPYPDISSHTFKVGICLNIYVCMYINIDNQVICRQQTKHKRQIQTCLKSGSFNGYSLDQLKKYIG